MTKPLRQVGVTYDIHETSKSQQLVIHGPREFMEDMHEDFKIGSRFPFKLDAYEDISVATWRLNALAIGRMANNPEGQQESIERANSFIESVAIAVESGAVIGDPNLAIQEYSPTGKNLKFEAEVKKPSVGVAQAQELVAGAVSSMATDLGVEDVSKIQVLQTGDSAQVSGLNVAIDSSQLGTDPYDDMFVLYGCNIEQGEQMLTYLMGAVAIAHADRLAQR